MISSKTGGAIRNQGTPGEFVSSWDANGNYVGNDFFAFSALGNIFRNGAIQKFAQGGAFTNSIVNRPTVFDMGMMGEAGPEAIMPLERDKSGRLGVRATGDTNTGNVTSIQIDKLVLQGVNDVSRLISQLEQISRTKPLRINTTTAGRRGG